MTSIKKAEANRVNSAKSTGPKSKQGKKRSSYNSMRHGLAVSALADPAWTEKIEKLTAELCCHRTDPEYRCLAREVAISEIEVLRVRAARTRIFDQFTQPSKHNSFFELPFRAQNLVESRTLQTAGAGDRENTFPRFQLASSVADSLMECSIARRTYQRYRAEAVSREDLRAAVNVKFAPQSAIVFPAWFEIIIYLKSALTEMNKLDRYERRALSRRSRAISDFDNIEK